MKRLPKVAISLSLAILMFSPRLAVSGPAAIPSVHPITAPLIGTWLLDTSRLPMPPEQRPKSVKITFGKAKGGMLSVHVDIVYASGEVVHSFSTAALDGTLAAVTNSPEGDAVALKQPTPSVLVMALRKDDILVSTRVYSVVPGGHGLVETVVYPKKIGSLVMKTNYFTRIR